MRAAASNGEANAALIRLLARSLDVAPRAVSLVAGETARIKRLTIAGPGPVSLDHLILKATGRDPAEHGA